MPGVDSEGKGGNAMNEAMRGKVEKELKWFLIDNRIIWTSQEWKAIRIKWFELECRYRELIKQVIKQCKKR